MTVHNHICGLYYILPNHPSYSRPLREYLPQLSLSAHAKIVSTTSRTTLTQTFVNPRAEAIPELRYTFPLYDGVSVVGFICTINNDRVIRGVVKERAEARKTYTDAVARGETAGLLEQLPSASDVFTTTIGNVPANATIKVDITYLGELKHDAEVDGIRYTIPTSIAPRFGNYPGELLRASTLRNDSGISIVVDVEMPNGCTVRNVQSPSHPISVTVGNTSVGTAQGQEMSLQKASATLSQATTELGDDFVLQIVASGVDKPVAVLETHPTIPNQRALMATLVPKFNLPPSRPEIVFLCDRSGSMRGGNKIDNLKTALHIFLKSLPVGVKFNICSFGSRHEFLFPDGSKTYDAVSLEQATQYVDKFDANFGGTDIYSPTEDAIKKRYRDMDLEIIIVTDGEIWDQDKLFNLVTKSVSESNGAIRVFTLGIGSNVSHSLIEGVAQAGNGFSQTVSDNENMSGKAVRMLKASLMPHIRDYTLEVRYETPAKDQAEDDFEVVEVEKVMDAMSIDVVEPQQQHKEPPKQPISLFDESANPDVEMTDASLDTTAGGKYSHVPYVLEPKLLQAPFIIPALYPFSRTTVFLLMSPGTVQRQPKAVVLRGTSAHGPLELEIPVAVLPEKAETIHQLAARKAVKELEDGRGWIYHAKDANDDKGQLLRDKYPGRYHDMVEREAVRLGVTYQVGGRWCSFVAVEATAEKASETAAPLHEPASSSSSRSRSSSPKRDLTQFMYPTDAMFGRGVGQTAIASFAQYASSSTPNKRLRGPLPAPTTMTFGKAPRKQLASMAARKSAPSTGGVSLNIPGDDKLSPIVALQTFAGSWDWDDNLLDLLHIDADSDLPAAAQEVVDQLGGKSDTLATALVLVHLELRLADMKDQWEMLAEKARGWLQDELLKEGKFGLDEFLAEAKKILQLAAIVEDDPDANI
ncbi:VIT-domain-containing protein [Canariomyces notabilis]|uniref:VIT-domain-containing protein n=1 Tax=Canariomyces notabilis TaxID=2074819 RepID=A0AAN6TMD9_9PEZI|nr:VIT-domain-containing protein [Canariomyces arenarius]